MDDFLTPVQTTRNVKTSVEIFENLSLKDGTQPSLSVSSTNRTDSPVNQKHKRPNSTAFLKHEYLNTKTTSASLPDDAVEILKSQPEYQDFIAVLQYLQYGIEGRHDFNVRVFGHQASRIINVLATLTIPERWVGLSVKPLSKEDAKARQMLLSCFSCLAGLGALHARTKTLTSLAASKENSPTASLGLEDTVAVLNNVIQPSSFIARILHDTVAFYGKLSQRHLIWQEFSSFVAGGKILSAVAEARPFVGSEINHDSQWLGDGNEYCKWLSKNICHAATTATAKDDEVWPMLAQLLKRGLSLGYRYTLVYELINGLLLSGRALWTPLDMMVTNLPRMEQKSFFFTLLRCLSNSYFNKNNKQAIFGVAAIVSGFVKDNQYLETCLIEWLTTTNGDVIMLGLEMRRAAFAVLASHEDKLQAILDKSIRTFSDQLHIQHDSIMQQEATAQVILIAVGYLNRIKPKQISHLSRSSPYLQAVSNRLGASLPRARFLGMIVGTTISGLVDAPGRAMKFDLDEMTSDEAKSWLELTNIDDHVGNVEDLKKGSAMGTVKPVAPSLKLKPGKSQSVGIALANTTSKIISIEEVDTDEEADDDLIPYQKPDEDPSDSDEDPTLINRSKPTAPVYIAELIKLLQVNDKPEVVELALKTAPNLIRRKAGFGTELAENIDTVASALINLQEGMSREEAQQLRLRSLIACLVALPVRMGPWLASMYFEGDFSLAQRATILTTVGLGARELAGYNDAPGTKVDKQASFPSKRLPASLEALYTPVDSLAGQIEHATLQPMALAAADKVTGPDVLKVRTFSSRLDVERKTAQKAKQRQTRVPKDIHKLLTESLFLPLCCRMSLLLGSRPNTNSTTLFEPHILRLFLQTLTILLSTLGPHALQLHTVTREALILLTNLHLITTLSTDAAVLPALLQLLLTTLDLNVEVGTIAEEKLVTEFGEMISELVAWAGNLSNVVSVPTTEESEGMGIAWTVLVAGIQVKWHEVGRKFQGRMIGLTGSDLDNF